MKTMLQKLTSRKFWLCVAAFLGSVATSITGIQTGNNVVITIGTICGVLSAAIYSATEAYVDGKNTEATKTNKVETTTINKIVKAEETEKKA